MEKDKITSRCCALWLALLLALCSHPARAEEMPSDLLRQAWEEYGLQAFSNAERLFDAVLDSEEASQQERWQAMLGQAFITHYQMPGRDPEEAIEQYEALLKEVGDQGEWRGQILGRLADCYVELTPSQMDKARSLYEEALLALPSESLLVQETMLRLLSSYLQRPDRSELARGLQRATELLPRFADTPFASVFHGLRAEMAFFADDYPLLAEALDSQYRAGINNVRVKEMVLFRLARLHEVELGNYAQAEDYYRRLAIEVPSSQKAYFAVLRADELKAGKLDSDYAPPLTPQVEDETKKERPDGR